MLTLADQAAELQSALEAELGLNRAAKLTAFYLYRAVFGDAAAKCAWGISYRMNLIAIRRAQRQIAENQKKRNYRHN